MSMPQQPPFSMPGGVPGMPGGAPGMPGMPGMPGTAPGKKGKAGKEPRAPKAKKPQTARDAQRRNMLLGGVLAVVATLAVFATTFKKDDTKVYVAYAKKTLAAGRTVMPEDIEYKLVSYNDGIEKGAAFNASRETLEAWLKGTQKAQARDPKTNKLVEIDWQVIGKRPKYPVLEGQLIHPSPVFTDTFQLANPLGEDEALVTVSVPASRAVLGQLRAGDLVDVVAARTGEETPAGVANQGENAVSFGPGPVVVASKVEIVSLRSDAVLSGQADTGIPSVYLLRCDSQTALNLSKLNSDQNAVLYLILRGHAPEAGGMTQPADSGAQSSTTTSSTTTP